MRSAGARLGPVGAGAGAILGHIAEELLVRVHRGLDRDLDQVRADVAGDRARVGLGLGAGVGGGHDDARHPLGPERIGGDQRHQRRVDPARDGDENPLEVVLSHVVGEAERERLVDLGHGLERLRERRRDRAARLGRRQASQRRRRAIRSAFDRAPHLDVDVAEHELFAELRAAGERLALGRDDDGVPVEDELVLAADRVADGERRAGLARALGDHALTRQALRAVVRRRGRVDDERRPGERFGRGRWAGVPDVLADREADPRAPELDQRRRAARLEVAAFVEHPVVRQQDLPVDAGDSAIGDHGGRVVDRDVALGEPDYRDDSLDLARHLVERGADRVEEVRLEQQILGRVAGEG